eukprot:m.127134 g.127134  ORF g.127134 m.127134 type:complete len:595 (+) comp29250_c0_seq3:130-1914(+)
MCVCEKIRSFYLKKVGVGVYLWIVVLLFGLCLGMSGAGCSAAWCKGRLCSKDIRCLWNGRRPRGRVTEVTSAMKRAKNERVTQLKHFCRDDVIDSEKNHFVQPPTQRRASGLSNTSIGRRLRVCKHHLDTDGNFLPLEDDPVLQGKFPELLRKAVLTSPVGSRLARAYESAQQKHMLSLIDLGCSPIVDTSLRAPFLRSNNKRPIDTCLSFDRHQKQKVTPISTEVRNLRTEQARFRVALNETEEALTRARTEIKTLKEQLNKSIPALSYESIMSGEYSSQSQQDAVTKAICGLQLERLHVYVEMMETVHVNTAWQVAVAELCPMNIRKTVLAFGFRDSFMLTLIKCRLGISEQVLSVLFKMGHQPTVGTVFKLTLIQVNHFLRRTVGAMPSMKQMRDDTLPEFDHAEFASDLMTADATNVRLNFKPHNPQGQKHSHSDYYGDNCGKIEVFTGRDGLPLWVSMVAGGRADESSIVSHHESHFKEWFKEFEKLCVDEDGKPFAPGVLADKGTKMRAYLEECGATYKTLTQKGQDSILTYHEYIQNELVSKARGYVEIAIGFTKIFAILNVGLSHRLVHIIDEIVYFCVFSTHFIR